MPLINLLDNKGCVQDSCLSDLQLSADIDVILEAGWSVDVPPPGHPVFLLTNNMKLYKAAFEDPAMRTGLDEIIDECGLEHLIPVRMLSELYFTEE